MEQVEIKKEEKVLLKTTGIGIFAGIILGSITELITLSIGIGILLGALSGSLINIVKRNKEINQ